MTTTKSESTVATRDQVAEHFGVHLRTAAAWFAAGAPGKSGAYDLEAITVWRAQRSKHKVPLRQPPQIPTAIRRLRAQGFFFRFDKKDGEILAEHRDGREHLVCTLERSEAFPRPALGRAIAEWLNGDSK